MIKKIKHIKLNISIIASYIRREQKTQNESLFFSYYTRFNKSSKLNLMKEKKLMDNKWGIISYLLYYNEKFPTTIDNNDIKNNINHKKF